MTEWHTIFNHRIIRSTEKALYVAFKHKIEVVKNSYYNDHKQELGRIGKEKDRMEKEMKTLIQK